MEGGRGEERGGQTAGARAPVSPAGDQHTSQPYNFSPLASSTSTALQGASLGRPAPRKALSIYGLRRAHTLEPAYGRVCFEWEWFLNVVTVMPLPSPPPSAELQSTHKASVEGGGEERGRGGGGGHTGNLGKNGVTTSNGAM